jgi:hypothetical protein
MEPRLADPRVGWFTVSQYDYGSNELKSDKKLYPRWRLEPKILCLRQGLVEPIKSFIILTLLHQKTS